LRHGFQQVFISWSLLTLLKMIFGHYTIYQILPSNMVANITKLQTLYPQSNEALIYQHNDSPGSQVFLEVLRNVLTFMGDSLSNNCVGIGFPEELKHVLGIATSPLSIILYPTPQRPTWVKRVS